MITESPREVVGQRGILVSGLVLSGGYVVLLMWLMSSSSYNFWGALLIAPVLIVLSIPVLAREARRENDRWLLWLLVAALILKLGSAIPRYWVDFVFYHGVADAGGYYRKGLVLATQFRQGNFSLDWHSYLFGTSFTDLVAGVVLAVIGPTKAGGFLVFSWMGFWGLFLFYRAFVVAVPEGRRHQYALLTFLMPTLLFWPSEIGKEAWEMLALGLAAYGAATALSGKMWRGLSTAALGLWMAALIRPHMGAMMGLALAAGFLLRKPPKELRQLGPVIKGVGLVVVSVLAIVLVKKAEAFLAHAGITVNGGLNNAVNSVVARTGGGGSAYSPSILSDPIRAPIDVVNVLFRPLLIDAHTIQSLVAALEGTFLLVFTVARFRWILASLMSVRRQPYVAVALVYALIFVLAFSLVANLGTLARERSQLLPMYFVLLTVPPLRSRNARRTGPRAVARDQSNLADERL